MPNPIYCTITSPKGGVGKSSLSQAIAVSAALAGHKVAVIDLDRQKTLSRWHSRRPAQAAKIDCFVGTFMAPGPGEMTLNQALQATASYDLVISDTPTSVEVHIAEMKRLLQTSQAAIIPTSHSSTDLESVIPWMQIIKQYTRSGFVLNRVKKGTTALTEAIDELNTAGLLCPIVVPQYEDLANVQKLGLAAVEVSGTSGRQEMAGVWKFVCNLIGIEAKVPA